MFGKKPYLYKFIVSNEIREKIIEFLNSKNKEAMFSCDVEITDTEVYSIEKKHCNIKFIKNLDTPIQLITTSWNPKRKNLIMVLPEKDNLKNIYLFIGVSNNEKKALQLKSIFENKNEKLFYSLSKYEIEFE